LASTLRAEQDGFGVLEFVGVPFELQERPDAGQKLLPIEGLAQKVIGTGLDTLDALLGCLKRRDHHNRNQDRPSVGLEAPANLVSVELRHDHVEEDQIGRFRRDTDQRLLTVLRRGNLVAFGGQLILQAFAIQGAVVYRENPRPSTVVGQRVRKAMQGGGRDRAWRCPAFVHHDGSFLGCCAGCGHAAGLDSRSQSARPAQGKNALRRRSAVCLAHRRIAVKKPFSVAFWAGGWY